MTTPEQIKRELALAQAAYTRGVDRRRAAVVAARRPGPDGEPLLSVYRIARVLGVSERTVLSLLATAAKEAAEGEGV